MSSNKQKFIGKKWCEYCQTGINWTKEDIAYHEQSKKHKKNMERQIEFKRQKIIREQEQQKAKDDESAKMIQEIERKAEEAMKGGTSKTQKQQNQEYHPRSSNSGIAPYIPRNNNKQGQQEQEQEIIKQQKKQKKKEELGSEFGSSYEESDSDEDEERQNFNNEQSNLNNNQGDLSQQIDRVWYLSQDENTGRLFFFNQLSGQKKYEKPIGLKLLDEEQKIWDEYVLNKLEEKEQEEENEIAEINEEIQKNKNINERNDEKENEKEDNSNKIQINEKEGIIQSGWTVVEEEDNFFNKYAIKNVYGEIQNNVNNQDDDENDDDEDSQGEMNENEIEQIAKIENQIEQGKISNQKQMMEALLLGSDNYGSKNISKQNEKLKKLIERNLDALPDRQQKMYKKKNWIDEDEEKKKVDNDKQKQIEITDNSNKQSEQKSQAGSSKGSLFKKRVTNDKNIQKIAIDE